MRITYASDKHDYFVVKVLLFQKQQKEEVAVIINQPLININEGEHLEAEGTWQVDKQWGRQFRTTQARIVLPTSEEGLIRYLSSDKFEGIGKKSAERIVEHFGKEVIEILNNFSGRLTEVKGVGKKQATTIKEAWLEQSESRELDLFFQSLGLNQSQRQKIREKYQNEAADVIRENPYRLCRDISGIGFMSADKIAVKLGLPLDHPDRICEGTMHIVRQSVDFGHTCYPHGEVTRKTSELLQQPPMLCQDALKSLVEDQRLIEENEFIYDRRLHRAEKTLIEILEMNLTYPSSVELPSMNHLHDSNFNTEQVQAIQQAFQSKVSIITGGPGVGKTTVVKEISRLVLAMEKSLALAAPTGRAAKRLSESTGMEAQTLHRLLKYDGKTSQFVHGQDNQFSYDFIVIDEVSMLDLRLASQVFEAIAPDTHTILIGDRDQLPSVGAGNVLHDFLASQKIPTVTLTKIYRQAENSFITQIAHRVNKGQLLPQFPNDKFQLRDFYWIEQESPQKVEELIGHLIKERIPQRFNISMKDIQVLSPMNKNICGNDSLNASLQKKINHPKQAQFTQGNNRFLVNDRVMQKKNNYDKKVFNGDIGYIKSIDTKAETFLVMFESEPKEYTFTEASELNLAYSISIHKSQGSEFSAVIIPVVNCHHIMLQRRLLYTGITRAKQLLILVGSSKAMNYAIENRRTLMRFSQLAGKMSAQLP